MSRFFTSNELNIFIGYAIMVCTFVYQTVLSFALIFVPTRLLLRRKDIKGQRILITGAGSGLGRQLAIEFSKHATCLVLVDINRQSLLQTEKLLDRRSTVFIYDCDVSDYKEVYEMAKKVKKNAGDVDILVNNAGIVSGKYLLDLNEENIVKTMKVNALAHFWTVKAFLPSMMERNRGHVVSIASIAGKGGAPKLTDYCASKYAAIGFAESLDIELREQKVNGIKVTIVCPFLMDTGLFNGARTNLGTTMTPEYVAKEIVLGVLQERDTIYLPYFFNYLCIVKEIWPRWFYIKLTEINGIIKGMENFRGRQANGVYKPTKAD